MTKEPDVNKQYESRGRPRNREIDTAIVNAGWQSIADLGFERMTVDNVINQAGCGRNTFYRRYSGKIDLIRAMLEENHMRMTGPPADADSPIKQLVAWIDYLSHQHTSVRGKAMQSILEALPRHPELRKETEKFDDRTKDSMYHLFQKCCEKPVSNELLSLVKDTLIGAMHFHMAIRQRNWGHQESIHMSNAILGMLHAEVGTGKKGNSKQ